MFQPRNQISGVFSIVSLGPSILVRGGGMVAISVAGLGAGDGVGVQVSYDGGSTWGTWLSAVPLAAPQLDYQMGATCLVRLTCYLITTGPTFAWSITVDEHA